MNKRKNSLTDLRAAAASLLALAVKQLFPTAFFAGGGVTSLGFYYDFLFSSPFEKKFISQIEELMEAWIRQKMVVQLKEMVPQSAKAYFQHQKEPYLSAIIERSSDPTFFLAQIADKMVLSSLSFKVDHLGEIGAFHLLKSEMVGKRVRVHGTAFFEKKDLKEFLKHSKEWVQTSHVFFGKEQKLFEEEEGGKWFWLPKGQKLRSLFIKRLEEEAEKLGYKSVFSHPISGSRLDKELVFSHQKIFEKEIGFSRFFEVITFLETESKDFTGGALDSFPCQGNRFTVFCSQKDLLEELISSLHFMTKIFKILDFEFQLIFLEKRKKGVQEEWLKKALDGSGLRFLVEESPPGERSRVECRVTDGLGRNWPVSFLYSPVISADKEIVTIYGSASLSFERSLALLLEKKKGTLPFWLAPEQVRVFSLKGKEHSFGKEVVSALKKSGFRTELCESKEELKVRLHKASQEGIPYVVTIGEQEEKSLSVTLRDVNARQMQSLSLQGLLEVLKSKLNGSNCSEL